ncbi:putative cytochrome P450 [Caenibius tardaugens NBRC 16725]|uniref:Putative cytochrome P450 n=1 Tax=Caenibius tardaugens NBRC 16725 TaxID=1219035 RepID=U2YN87_9SPHN|nr:cytochrome P450 [Caenibius tardaugens]AZI35080.1 cytochrome P450 [Caenibius tardaugens NBRC 16725]GAD50265.1 putative cytochrome P450 [Caenibius tardaugens NBRC 16725]
MTDVAVSSLPPVVYDPFDYSLHDDPYPTYRRLRDEAPVFHNEKFGFYALSRYEDCSAAVRDFKTFSSASGTSLEDLKAQVQLLINTDPPVHSKMRHLIAGMFTPAKVAPLEDAVRTMARELLAPHLASGRIDIIADFAAKLPMAIICRLLGFPREDEDRLRHLTDTVVHRDEGVFGMPDEGMHATLALYEYFNADIAERARGARREDIIALLMDAQADGRLTHEELIGYIYILSIAGNETTTKLIGNMCYQLHSHPDQAALLRDNPALIESAVEETMRFDGPTQMMARTTTRDVTLHGVTIPANSKVALLFTSANRDERKFDRAEDYDIRRNPRDHLGFGGGLHACLGAALARLEARVAIEEILAALGDFSVDESSLERMHSPQVRGLTREILTFTPSGK